MVYFFLIILFTLLQALLLGRIHIFGVATPLLYVYLVLLFPRGFSKWQHLVWAFVMGLAVDMFESTPGLAASTMTLTAFVQPHVLELFLKKEDGPDFAPSIATMGWTKYFAYALILVSLYCFVFFTLEAFSMVYWSSWLLGVVGSIVLTMVIILIVDSVRK